MKKLAVLFLIIFLSGCCNFKSYKLVPHEVIHWKEYGGGRIGALGSIEYHFEKIGDEK